MVILNQKVDQEDVDAVLAGDIDRFEGIVRRWQGPLIQLAFRHVRDEARAEEFAQEAFLKCFRSLRQWRREAQFSTWLFSVAISVYRSKMRRLEPIRAQLEEQRVAAPSAEDEMVDQQRRTVVLRAVDRLPALYREPLHVFYFQEQDLTSTARILGLREGTLKSRLSRARAMLRDLLKGQLP